MFRITEDPSSRSLVHCLVKITRNGSIVSVDMEKIEPFFVILTKYCTRFPDDGSFVIRNMSEQI